MEVDMEEGLDEEIWGWERFFGELRTFLELSSRDMESANEAYSDHVLERLQHSIRSLRYISDALSPPYSIQLEASELAIVQEYLQLVGEVVIAIQRLSQQWEAHIDSLQTSNEDWSYQTPVDVRERRHRGRPRFDIGRDQLEYLSSLNFSWTAIASMLGVSRMTIYRRRQEFDMLDEPVGHVSDADLYSILREMRDSFPEMGEVMVLGRLRSMGYKVKRNRVRTAIRATDPLHTALRGLRGRTARRPYSVAGPNSLWHIDGHHKLIRWRLVTHGGIDGFTRMIVYLKCSPNNRASTVYDSFLQAVRQFGLPSRVRSDQGRENVLVAQHMLEHRGDGRGSIITGASTHNQRIERFWRDMHRCVIKTYYRLFYHLENIGLLDPIHEVHLFALHYIYTPRINSCLRQFQSGWNNHPIRTEHNRSPYQLFVEGSLSLQRSGLIALDFFDRVDEDYYGVEEEGLYADDEGVTVPERQFELQDQHFHTLQREVNPVQSSNNYGIELYERTLEVINRIIFNNQIAYSQWIQ